MSEQLKPCPFCGGEVYMNEYADYVDGGFEVQHEDPQSCRVEMGIYDTLEEAIRAWNTRAEPKARTMSEWQPIPEPPK